MPHPLTDLCKCDRCETLAFMKANVEKYFSDKSIKEKTSATDFFYKHYKLKVNLNIPIKEDIPHHFITISLPSEQIKEETNLIDKIQKIKYCQTDTLGVFEYHPHFHIHILIKHKYMNKFNLIKSFAKKFDIKHNFVDVKFSKDPELYDKRVQYIYGIKQQDKKHLVEIDKKIKMNENLPDKFLILNNKLTIF